MISKKSKPRGKYKPRSTPSKKRVAIRMYPGDEKIIKTKFGSLQVFFDRMTKQEIRSIKSEFDLENI